MARPHIEFIHAQAIPWQRGLYGGGHGDVAARILSLDDSDGQATTIIRYPAGWARTTPEYLTVDAELLVLDGALTIGPVTYRKWDYAFLPAGHPRPSQSSPDGALVLTCFSGPPEATPGAGPGSDPARLVLHLPTRATDGQHGPRQHMNSEGFAHSGTVHKLLRRDPVSGEMSWIVGLIPGWSSGKVETHPVAEEEFSLGGDIHMPNGIMRAGAYFWRPPHIPHGPFGTVAGTLHFCRCKGGPMATTFTDDPLGVRWDAPYRPILPDGLRPYAEARPEQTEQCY